MHETKSDLLRETGNALQPEARRVLHPEASRALHPEASRAPFHEPTNARLRGRMVGRMHQSSAPNPLRKAEINLKEERGGTTDRDDDSAAQVSDFETVSFCFSVCLSAGSFSS